VGGYELVSKIRRQAETWGIDLEVAEASRLKSAPDGFVVQAYGRQYKGRAVILAFGKTPRDLDVPGEPEFKGRGVSYCATCDAPLFKGRAVAVAGYGDFGLEAALVCAKYAKKVYTLSKTDKLIGHPGLAKKVLRHKKIELVPYVQIQEIAGLERVSALRCLNIRTNELLKLPVDGLFVEIGYVVDSGWLADFIDLDEQGQIVIGPDQSTSVPGVFAAGDVRAGAAKRVAGAVGDGALVVRFAHDVLSDAVQAAPA
jgi:thioredoxin reductase (NADPH)